MLHAAVARCPVFGGTVKSFGAEKAKAVAGVKQVVQISSGIAVVAENTWSAMEGRNALAITWDEGANAKNSSEAIRKLYHERAEQTGAIARKDGDAEAALAGASKKVEAIYEVPFLAHATMEPINCTADVRVDGCDIYAPTQFQTFSQMTGAKLTGLKPEQVRVHTTYLGGGFGRRAEQDFIMEAVELSKAMKAPVQVTWSREDDMQHDFYRPAVLVKMNAGLDDAGSVVAWKNRIVGPSIMSRFFPGSVKNGIDDSSTEGIATLKYGGARISLWNIVMTDPGVPVGFWRSVGNSHNGYIAECFVDEMAKAAGKDPVEFRRELLAKDAAAAGVVNLRRRRPGGASRCPQGRYRGIAVVESFGSYVAEVAEISLDRKAEQCGASGGGGGGLWAARESGNDSRADRGLLIYGLSAALKGEITIANGRVEQSNFNDYDLVRINETPRVEVHIVDSHDGPGGIGEPGTPPIAPAVCNAIFSATGKPVRRLPIRAEDLA